METASGLSKGFWPSLLLQIAADVEARAAAEAQRLEAERLKAQEAAAKYSRKQKVIQEKIAKTAEEAEKSRWEKEVLQVCPPGPYILNRVIVAAWMVFSPTIW